MPNTGEIYARLNALADPIRGRLLLGLERQELAVHELRSALQLPQSTVSRHLRILAGQGWVTSRADGTTNWYRMGMRELDESARRLWQVVRTGLADTPAARRDAERIRSVVAARHTRSQEFFATGAGQWDRLRAELFGSGVEFLALGGLLDPTWVVADLGAGTGQLAALVAPMVSWVIAVDESQAMLDAARTRLGERMNVELRQGALEALPIESETVDLAAAVLVLHHLPEPARALEEASRVLRTGGRLIVVDMMPHERVDYRELMGHQWLGFDQEHLEGWAGAAGFDRFCYRPLAPQPDAKGPLLFVASAVKTSR